MLDPNMGNMAIAFVIWNFTMIRKKLPHVFPCWLHVAYFRAE